MGWGDKNLTETNDVLAAPDQTVQIHGKEKMDECRWGGLAREEGIGFYRGKQDGWMQTKPPRLHG